MRGATPFLLSAAGLVLMSLSAMAKPVEDKQVSACLEEGKKQFSMQRYQLARNTFSRCVRLAPENEDTQLSLAGVLLTLEDLDGAETAFQAALKNMKRTSPYLSYTYSMLGDIALKRQDNDKALAWYTKSLESNAANVNSLVGKGVITEYKGDKKAAAEFYRSALAVEPLNLIARKRLINLEPYYMNDAEILAALKQRYAVKPDAKELSADMRKTFENIHQAEQRQGVTYLKNKYPKVPVDYLVTINQGTEFERDMLTLAGYQTLQKHIEQDAIHAFQQAGVPMKDVFSLRDKKGKKVFNEDNTLTANGFFVYTEALQNRKAFLLPNESVPLTKQDLEQIAKLEDELKEAGYMEISRKELRFIEKQTKCSEETLRTQLGLYILPISKNMRRYFIIANEKEQAEKGVPYYYLMKEKAKYDPSIKVPRNTLVERYAFYGYSICLDDGKMIL